MKNSRRIKVFWLLFLFPIYFIGTSFQFPHGDYVGVHGFYKQRNEAFISYPYRITLSFSGNLLHRVEKDDQGNIKIDKHYSGGASTSNGATTSYRETDGTEILVGIQGGYINIYTKLEYGAFKNHIRWERSR